MKKKLSFLIIPVRVFTFRLNLKNKKSTTSVILSLFRNNVFEKLRVLIKTFFFHFPQF